MAKDSDKEKDSGSNRENRDTGSKYDVTIRKGGGENRDKKDK